LPTNDSAAEASPPKATGVTDYGYRWYDAPNARWLSQDPIGVRGGLNLYAFVTNDGVNSWDVLGLAETYPCNCDDDIGRYKNLAFDLSTRTTTDKSYDFQDPQNVVKDFFKKAAQDKTVPEDKEPTARKFNETVEKWTQNIELLLNYIHITKEIAQGFVIVEIRLDLSLDMCVKSTETGKYEWKPISVATSKEPWTSLIKETKKAANEYQSLIIEGSTDLINEMNKHINPTP
jgi:RHS repeat-associated protein